MKWCAYDQKDDSVQATSAFREVGVSDGSP
jgi:hypothetical protein